MKFQFFFRSFIPLSLLAFSWFSAAAKPPPKTKKRAQTCRSIGAKKHDVKVE
jgi:hypothetical protein